MTACGERQMILDRNQDSPQQDRLSSPDPRSGGKPFTRSFP
jgi:hypothetical protein